MATPARIHLRCGEGGFVLPVALVVMIVLSMIAATGLHSTRADLRAAMAAREAAVALAAADAGLARTVARWDLEVPTLPPADDSVIVGWQTLPDGSLYRSVVYRPAVGAGQPPSGNVLLYTTGRAPPPALARRTVAAVVKPGVSVDLTGVCCDASLKLQGRLTANGNGPLPTIDGTDQWPPGWTGATCPVPSAGLPGLTAPTFRRFDINRPNEIDGNPPMLEDPTIDPSEFTDFGGTTYAELAALANVSYPRSATLADEIAPVESGGQCDTSQSTNWGAPLSPASPCGSYFPVVHVAGNLTLEGTAQGQGILLVDGDLEMLDNAVFYGVIIVMGRAQLDDQSSVVGGLVVRGGPRGNRESEVLSDARVLYSSCAVDRSFSGVTGNTGGGGSSVAGTSAQYWFEVIS